MTGPVFGPGFVRLVAGGTMAGTQTWSTGVAVAAGGIEQTQTQVDGLLTAFRNAFTTLWGAAGAGVLGARNDSTVNLRTFRAYYYATGAAPVTLQAAQDVAPINGTSSQAALPYQVAVVASLLTGRPGRSFRGRMYLPYTAATFAADHQLSQPNVDSLAAALKTMFDSINTYTTANGPGDVAVAGSAGPIPISQVRVDSELDIQRRRSDKILPLRQAVSTLA